MENFTRRVSAAAFAAGIAAFAPGRASADAGNLGLVATRSPEAQVGWLPPRYIDSDKPVQFVLDHTRRHLRVIADPKSRLLLGLTCPDPELQWNTESGTKPAAAPNTGPTAKLNDRGEGASEVEIEAPRREGDARGGKVLCNDTKNPGDRKSRAELTFEVASQRTGLPTLPLVPTVPSLEPGESEGELPKGDLNAAARFPRLGGQFGLGFDALPSSVDPRFGLTVGPEVSVERLPQQLTDGIDESAQGLHVRASLLAQMKYQLHSWLTVALGGGGGVCHTPSVTSDTGAKADAETEGCLTATGSLEAGRDFGLKVGTDATFLGKGDRVWQVFTGFFSRFGSKK